MRKHTYHLCLLTAFCVMFAVNCKIMCHWDSMTQKYQAERLLSTQWEETCDSLRAYTQFLDRVDEIRSEKQCILAEKLTKLNDDVRATRH